MLKSLRSLKQEQMVGLLFVLVLHGAALYGLWSYRIIPTPDEAFTLMVNLINPPPPERPPQPEKTKPPPKPQPVEPLPEHQHLVVDTPVVKPDEPVVYAPPPPLPSPSPPVPAAPVAPPLPPQPLMLSGELSVSCPERSPPDYPVFSKRMNEQGKVVLRVELGEDGRIANAVVKTSSGYRRLDDAALNAVKTWRCKPAIQNGVAVAAVALQPFSFILEGR